MLKKLKRKRTVLKNVTVPPNKILEHHKSFFTDNQSNLSLKQQNVTNQPTNQVNDHFRNY